MTNRKLQNICVTGGFGFIGSAFIRYLLSLQEFEGFLVNVDALRHGSNPANLEAFKESSRLTSYPFDICQRDKMLEICQKHQIDTIVHFAAESHVDRSIKGPQTFLHSNIVGTFELLELLRSMPHLHFHHISTDEVFGSIERPYAFVETSRYEPNSPYSATKAASDHLVRAWAHTYSLSYTMSNCSNNYGPYQHPEKLIPHMIDRCLRNEELPIYGTGHHVRDWLHVEDHVRAIWMILKKAPKGSFYNIGGRSECDNLSLVKRLIGEVATQLGVDKRQFEKKIRFVTDRPGHDARYAIDPSLIENELDFRPHYTFEKGISETVKWYLQNKQWLQSHSPVGIQTH